ncbi:hypothetical protein EZS27_009938 [termite gut metagenome]|uniref:Uncharacterized protein n=1 Tax=termite gut metagenome TaxID=433724 RepID=A0A5J4S857_9ZZZZ
MNRRPGKKLNFEASFSVFCKMLYHTDAVNTRIYAALIFNPTWNYLIN